MERPILEPTFTNLEPEAERHPVREGLAWLVRCGWRIVRLLLSFLFLDPFALRRDAEPRTLGGFFRGVCYRLALVPVLVLLAALTLVYTGTHPFRGPDLVDQSVKGLHLEDVSFQTADGVTINAWIFPALDERNVIRQDDILKTMRFPGAVLVHDFGQSRQQMLPLVRPLHDKGVVVMVVALRSCNIGQHHGETFGLLESRDVVAAVSGLRQLSYVDAHRVCVIGTGTGGNAALLAARADPTIAAAIVDRPVSDFTEAAVSRIFPKHDMLQWLNPICELTFEQIYSVQASNLNAKRVLADLHPRPVLCVNTVPNAPEEIRMAQNRKFEEFLRTPLKLENDSMAMMK